MSERSEFWYLKDELFDSRITAGNGKNGAWYEKDGLRYEPHEFVMELCENNGKIKTSDVVALFRKLAYYEAMEEKRSMFSSNQVLKVSCDEQQLETVIKFYFEMEGSKDPSRLEHICFQKTAGGRIVIGWYPTSSPLPNGWEKFPVEHPSVSLVAALIKDFIAEHPATEHVHGDGSVRDGYVFEAIADEYYEDDDIDPIKESFYALFAVKGFINFYAK